MSISLVVSLILGFLATFICFCVTVLFYRYLYFVVNQIKLQSYSNPGSTAGGPERGFRPCFSDILSQKFSSVCGKARHVLVNEYFNHQSSWVSHGNVGMPPKLKLCAVKFKAVLAWTV